MLCGTSVLFSEVFADSLTTGATVELLKIGTVQGLANVGRGSSAGRSRTLYVLRKPL